MGNLVGITHSQRAVQTIASGSGNKEVVDCRGISRLIIRPASGGTITYSVVDSLADTAHGYDQTGPSAADAIVKIEVEGLFYMVEAGTASCDVHIII